MPSPPAAAPPACGGFGGDCYHELIRGTGRARVFHYEHDYAAFVELPARVGHWACSCGWSPQ